MFITDFITNYYLYIIFIGIPVSLIVTAYLNQNLLLYCNYLPKNSQGSYTYLPSRYNLPFEDVYLSTRDGIRYVTFKNEMYLQWGVLTPSFINRIHAWFIRYRHAKGYDMMEAYLNTPTLLYFHGNAGNISHRLHTVKDLYKHCRCNILLLSYRGYGQSEGTPTEQGLIYDSEAALNFVYERKDINHDKIYLFGRSLGGAVALRLVTLHPNKIKGLILENTFTSISDMIDVVLPYLKYFKFLSRNQWRNIDRIRELKPQLPVLFLSGMQDELVPPSMMQTLIDACSSQNKAVVRFENGTHNDTWMYPGYYKSIAKFLYQTTNAQYQQQQELLVNGDYSLATSDIDGYKTNGSHLRMRTHPRRRDSLAPLPIISDYKDMKPQRGRSMTVSSGTPSPVVPKPKFSDNMDLFIQLQGD